MTGLNVLLWTLAIILIIGAALVVTFLIYCFIVRNKEWRKWQDKSSFGGMLDEAQSERDELMKQNPRLN